MCFHRTTASLGKEVSPHRRGRSTYCAEGGTAFCNKEKEYAAYPTHTMRVCQEAAPRLLRCHTIAPHRSKRRDRNLWFLLKRPAMGPSHPLTLAGASRNTVMQCTKLQLQQSLAQLPPFEPTHNNLWQCVTKILWGFISLKIRADRSAPGLGPLFHQQHQLLGCTTFSVQP